jgi:sulfite reductase alpha subunit-like flavoprotein
VSSSAALKQKHIVLPSRGALNPVNTNVNNPSLQQNTSVVNASTTNNSKLFNNLTKMRPSSELETDAEPDTRSQLKGEAHDHDPAHDDTQAALPPDIIPVNNVFVVKLLDNVRVTPESHWQDVRLLTFEIPVGKDYLAGDTITIYPKNFPQDVQTLIDLQGWNSVADIPLVFKAEAPDYFSAQNLAMPPAWPGFHPLEGSSLRELLTHNLDFTAIPKRKFFNDLAHHTDDPTHKERLLDFTNPALSDEFFDYTTRPRRSILEVLQDFPSVKLPWQWAATIFPPIRGRQFSICSGGALQDHTTEGETVKLQILVAIVKYKTVLKKVRQGLCSRYIASLRAGTVMGITKEPNDTFFRAMQATYGRPVIMVGPGTGVAPCRSLIWQRASEVINFPNRKAEMALFFGNRNREADFFFKDEWKDPSLAVKVFTAFSRDQREKIYVQDLIRKEGYLVNRLIQEEALIIVCGSSGKMPQQVRNAFIDAMEEYGGPWESREKVEEAFKGIEKDGLYIQETW